MSDTGAPDERLAAALVVWSAAPSRAAAAEVHAALVGARVFVAIAARSTAERVDSGTGLRAESSAVMSLLTLVGSAGGRAVPVFLGVADAVGFRPGARPVPLAGPEVCGAALADGAVAVLLDPPGAALAVTGAALSELAAGRVPVAGTALSARVGTGQLRVPDDVDPGLVPAVAAALADEPVESARLLQGPDGLVLALVPSEVVEPAALAALAARVVRRLGAVLPPGGLDLGLVPRDGPGLPVPLVRRPAGRRGWIRRRR